MICNLSQLDSEHSFAWEMAHNHLTTLHHENHTLTLDATDAAIKLAEDNIILADQKKLIMTPSVKFAAAATTPSKDPHVNYLEKKVSKLTAMLADYKGGNAAGGKCYCNSKGKDTKTCKLKSEGVKYTYPLCTTCNCHHQGGAEKCVKSRDIAAEIKKLEKLAELQKHMSSRKDAAHMAKASAASAAIEEINESDPEYSTSHYPITVHYWHHDNDNSTAYAPHQLSLMSNVAPVWILLLRSTSPHQMSM